MKIKRPLCTAAFIWAAVLWLLGRTGLDFFSFASPDPPIKIEKEKVVATGTVYQKDVYDSITNLYLRNSNLIIQEKKYPIENIKVTLENQKLTDSVFQGDLTAVYGSLEQIPRASNPGQFDERSYYYPRKVKWYPEKGKSGFIYTEPDQRKDERRNTEGFWRRKRRHYPGHGAWRKRGAGTGE